MTWIATEGYGLTCKQDPAADHPSRSTLDRLAHEYELKDELDRSY